VNQRGGQKGRKERWREVGVRSAMGGEIEEGDGECKGRNEERKEAEIEKDERERERNSPHISIDEGRVHQA
jgi:hypothetical protein